jgi:hypothetical protein
LDVAEDLVEDPDTVASLTGMAGNVTGAVSDLLRAVVPGRRSAGGGAEGAPDEDDDEPRVHRIQVT